MSDIAVSVEGLGKRYRIAHQRDPYGRLTESLSGALRAPVDRLRGKPRETAEWIWALRDVSFEVRRGDVVGVIGRNGAGKTTLLKILSRITEPTTGSAALRGRVGSLLEVGTGFHPELTGRENIFMSGSILGMRRSEIERRFDEIVAFSEVERFLDTPVKRYSSGMQVRLGFAVAAHLETEILIVDEVLAVGDTAFQRKCLAKMEDVSHKGRTVLFVSHNMPAVEALCSYGVVLDGGSVVATGPAREMVSIYLDQAVRTGAADLADRPDRRGDGRVRIRAIESSLRTGAPSELRLAFKAEPGLRNVSVAVGFFTARGEGAAHLWSALTGDDISSVSEHGAFVCRMDRAPLLPGTYSINVYCTVNGIVADWVVDAARLEVLDGDFFGTGRLPPPGYGSVLVPHRWTVEPDTSSEDETGAVGGLTRGRREPYR